MTTFVLVSGAHTDGRVWREVADALRKSGAEVYSATLTGMGGRRHEAGRDTDLETHIDDLVRLIDGVPESKVVLVGHCYGIHPVLGAADRRPERVARIVHLDIGVPRDGDPAFLLVPDAELRERLSGTDAGPGGGDAIPPPAPDGWGRWGSTVGLSPEALARLSECAAPQPVGTLTRPLRLTGAAARVPVTGVLCTANGPGIALVEALAGMGDPRLAALVDPNVDFFEIGTGHWPMLSVPEELAGVLSRAAAGEGYRLDPTAREEPAHLRPFLLDVPERHRERIGRMDVYPPDGDGPGPAVVFVHGGPVVEGVRPTPRDWPAFIGYARYVAGLGAVAVTMDHRLHDVADYRPSAEDVAAAVEAVRADPRVDADRIALWFFSAGGLLSAQWLAAPPPWVRCVAVTYPVLAPLPMWGTTGGAEFRPVDAVEGAGRLPIVLTRVESEHPAIAETVEEFVAAAKDAGADVEVIDVPGGHHGFETVDHTDEARRAVIDAVRSVLGHLRG